MGLAPERTVAVDTVAAEAVSIILRSNTALRSRVVPCLACLRGVIPGPTCSTGYELNTILASL